VGQSTTAESINFLRDVTVGGAVSEATLETKGAAPALLSSVYGGLLGTRFPRVHLTVHVVLGGEGTSKTSIYPQW